MRSFVSIVFAVAALTLILPGSIIAQQDSDRIAAWFDYACFDYPPEEGKTLVEFYYGLLRHQMTFAMVDSAYQAMAFVWIELEDENGVVLDTLYKKIATRVESPAEMNNKNIKLPDQISYIMSPGTYVATLTIEDIESQSGGIPLSGKIGQRRVRVVVPDFKSSSLAMSGIELSYKIEALPANIEVSDYRSIDKSNRRIVPNPSRLFVTTDSSLYFYSEVYNLAFGLGVNKEFYVTCNILDTYGDIVSQFGTRRHIKPGSSAIVSSVLDIHDLSEGSYALSIEVTDAETGAKTKTDKPFQLLPSSIELSPGVDADSFTEDDAEYLSMVLEYILPKEQKKTLEQLDLEGKKNFFEDFWERTDPDPTTRLNEFKVEVFRRFRYVNDHYSVSIAKRDDGWKSDRGRVYIVYGEPDEIEKFPSTMDLNPFEKWNYHNLGSQGPAFFIFEDETGYGDFRLAHSDANGEPYDSEWEYLLEQLVQDGRITLH